MKIYTLERTDFLPISLETAWDFFSDPNNLPIITPRELNLRITSDTEEKIYPGMIITYTVTPMAFIKTTWATEITQVDSPGYFVDEQRFGPCRFWHHKHFFTEAGDKTEVRDLVHYSLPFGSVGKLANLFFVSRKLHFIFNGIISRRRIRRCNPEKVILRCFFRFNQPIGISH